MPQDGNPWRFLKQPPGDSKWWFHPLVGGCLNLNHLTFEKGHQQNLPRKIFFWLGMSAFWDRCDRLTRLAGYLVHAGADRYPIYPGIFQDYFTSHDRRIPIFSATRPPPTLHYSTRILWLKGNQQGGIQVATPYLIVLRNRSSKQWYTSWHNPTKSCEALQLQVGALAFTYVWGWLGGLFLPPLWAVTETV